jgi:23S rRNA (cytosine1962-C5)-methyltransferase
MELNTNKLIDTYELIDCGNQRKLERFGDYVLIRPEPSAFKQPELNLDKWKSVAHAEFISKDNTVFGSWEKLKNMPEEWQIKIKLKRTELKVILGLTNTKHIGIFPEQVLNWKYISKKNGSKSTLLNLFAYTGISSVVAAKAGFNVCHVDSVKKINEWGKKNMINSGIDNIRWINDDALRFVKREIKRKNKYSGLILDPPAIGKGTKNETWILERDLEELMDLSSSLLTKKSFVIISLYSQAVKSEILIKHINKYFAGFNTEFFESIKGLSKYGGEINHGMTIRLERFTN